MSSETISTAITKLFNIKYPIILAGMNKAAGPKLAAAVTNGGGLGVIGGVSFTPRILKLTIKNLKKYMNDPNAPFGIDLLLPKIGGGARKTNYDYTKGKLNELIDVIIESGCKLFVSAVGVPPVEVVKKLHKNNIVVMNMIGHPKHVKYACAVGVDIICCQGGEGGGHTGAVATSLLIPKCRDIINENNYMSPLLNKKVLLVGAGGIYDGRGLAMALSLGAQAVWVGTRFVVSVEGGASMDHKNSIIKAGYDDTVRTLVYTGRPMRIIKNPYQKSWDENTQRQKERDELLSNGIIPAKRDTQNLVKGKKDKYNTLLTNPHLAGQVVGAIDKILTAKQIMENMMTQAIQVIRNNHNKIESLSNLRQSKL